MKKLQKLAAVLTAAVLTMSMPVTSLAMTTKEFDEGMRKGIDYFNKGLYYEAKDEFQWFCDANWGGMNAGQQKYALDYLGSTNNRIQKWEEKVKQQRYDKYLGEWCLYGSCRFPDYTITFNHIGYDYVDMKYEKTRGKCVDIEVGHAELIDDDTIVFLYRTKFFSPWSDWYDMTVILTGSDVITVPNPDGYTEYYTRRKE